MDAPDLVLTEATLWTLDDDQPEAEAIAFRQGRILAIGSHQRITALAGPRTETVSLGGATVVPGFIDAHTHAARLGETHFRADLADIPGPEAAVDVLRQRAQRTPPGGWVIGWNWDDSSWEPPRSLTLEDLERVSADHPVMARRVCGHKAVVNRAALEALDLPSDTPGLDEGPEGLLTEDAADLAWERCAPAYETCVKGLTIESRRLASLGITSVADTAGPRDVRLLTRGARDGFVLQRSGLYLREELLDHVEALGLGPIPSDRCALLGVKVYTDGSVGARTAALNEPYEDNATGVLLRDADQVAATAERARRAGLQLKAHAIGDRAIEAVLDGVEAAGLGPDDRPRVEHLELATPALLDRMAEGGTIACFQPNFIGNWQGEGGLYDQALGAKRRLAMNPLRSALDRGVHVAFSSDGMPYGPLYGLQCALDHPNPKERLTVEQALHAYTTGAAYAIGAEDRRGRLKEGLVGDAVVLSDDPRRTGSFEGLEVTHTVIGGRMVHGPRN